MEGIILDRSTHDSVGDMEGDEGIQFISPVEDGKTVHMGKYAGASRDG